MAKTVEIKLLTATRRACRKYHSRRCPSLRACIGMFYKTYCKALNNYTSYEAVTLKIRSNKKYPLCTKLFYEFRVVVKKEEEKKT